MPVRMHALSFTIGKGGKGSLPERISGVNVHKDVRERPKIENFRKCMEKSYFTQKNMVDFTLFCSKLIFKFHFN